MLATQRAKLFAMADALLLWAGRRGAKEHSTCGLAVALSDPWPPTSNTIFPNA